MKRPRPGPPLTDNERWAGLLARAIEVLGELETDDPHPDIVTALHILRFVRDGLEGKGGHFQ